MTYARSLAALLVVLGGLTEARAQFVVGGGHGAPAGAKNKNVNTGVALGGGVGVYPGYPRTGLSIGYGNPYYGPRYTTNFFIFAPPPPPLVPVQPIYGPRPIVIAQPVVVGPQAEPNLVDPIVIRPRINQPLIPDDAPLPGAIAGGFRPIRPEDRARAQQPVQPDKIPAPKKAADPPAEDRPDPLVAGKQAFANREYGRALRFFKQAIEARPDDFMAVFLLAQAQFALGKYRESVATIHDGLRLHKDWPASRFKPQVLYGANAADFADHMEQLQDALKAHPNDAVLLFLSAYQLWFDGQEDEARKLFGRARKLVTEPRFIDLFLLGPPGGPVVVR